MSARHFDFVQKVIEYLRGEQIPGIKPGDIRYEEFDGIKQPSYGIVVSMLPESEGRGTNTQDDIRYGVQVTRILSKLHPSEGLKHKSEFRDLVRNLFHRKRLGVADEELITTIRHSQWVVPRRWKKNIDASAMNVYCLVRELRE
jgi:hypothetical protein